jgi:hypothetical protein
MLWKSGRSPRVVMALAKTLTKRQTNSLKAAELPSEGRGSAVRVATSVMRENAPIGL